MGDAARLRHILMVDTEELESSSIAARPLLVLPFCEAITSQELCPSYHRLSDVSSIVWFNSLL